MIFYDEKSGTYILKMRGATVIFFDMKSMIDFARIQYNFDLLTILN